MAKFVVYPDISGQYRWRLKAANGRIVADSGESYVSKQGAKDDVAWVKKYAAGADEE
jgi:uncharacterized protein YegP (UPF0339 family)